MQPVLLRGDDARLALAPERDRARALRFVRGALLAEGVAGAGEPEPSAGKPGRRDQAAPRDPAAGRLLVGSAARSPHHGRYLGQRLSQGVSLLGELLGLPSVRVS